MIPKDIRLQIKIKNNLILKRAEELWEKGIAQVEIAEKCGVSPSELGQLLNFKLSPIGKRGSWILAARKISNTLGVPLKDLFPEHFQTTKERNSYDIELAAFELKELYEAQSVNPQELYESIELKEINDRVLSTLTPREEKVLDLYYRKGYGYRDIAKDFDCSVENIRRIAIKALRKIRHPTRAKLYRNYVSLESLNTEEEAQA